MSNLKCIIIVIILAEYQLSNCPYRLPPKHQFVHDGSKLSKQAVKCINDLAAYFKVPSPYNPKSTEVSFDELLFASTKNNYTYGPYLNEGDDHFVILIEEGCVGTNRIDGTTTLSKLMMAKSAIAHLKSPDPEYERTKVYLPVTESTNIITNYYSWLLYELIPVGIKTPKEFCYDINSLMLNILDYTEISIVQSDCMKQLKNFHFPTDEDRRHKALEYGYLNVTLSEFEDIYYGELYMKHLITNVEVTDFDPLRFGDLDEPEGYCKTKTTSTGSSSSGN